MEPFIRKPLHILTSKWFAVVLISLLLSCLSIFPIENASAQTCGWNWDILSISGIKTNYHSGETISGNISFRLNNAANSSAIQQLLIGIIDLQNKVIDVKCVYNGVPKTCPAWTTGTASFSLKTPVTPGNYKVIAADYFEYSCSHALNKFPSLYSPTSPYCKDITTITISAPPPPPPCSASWDISVVSGLKSNYKLGESINGNVKFTINNSAGSPGITQQILIGIADQTGKVYDLACIYNGQPKECPGFTTGSGSFSLKNPGTLGSYSIIGAQDAQHSCQSAQITPDRTRIIAKITIPAPPGKPGTGEDNGTVDGPDTNTVVIICFIAAVLILSIAYSASRRKPTKKYIRFVLFLVLISFVGYLFAKYGIPVIKDWFTQHWRTIRNVLLALVALAIIGVVVRQRIKKKGPISYIYVMSNSAYKKTYKIGHSRDPAKRAEDLGSATGVLGKFEVDFKLPVAEADAALIESQVHKELERYRVVDNREFFEVQKDIIINTIRKIAGK